MSLGNTRRLQLIRQTFFISLPIDFVRELKLKKGDFLEFDVNDDKIIVKRAEA